MGYAMSLHDCRKARVVYLNAADSVCENQMTPNGINAIIVVQQGL